MHISICLYVCTDVCMYLSICLSVSLYLSMYPCIQACMSMYMYIFVYVYLYISTYLDYNVVATVYSPYIQHINHICQCDGRKKVLHFLCVHSGHANFGWREL